MKEGEKIDGGGGREGAIQGDIGGRDQRKGEGETRGKD